MERILFCLAFRNKIKAFQLSYWFEKRTLKRNKNMSSCWFSPIPPAGPSCERWSGVTAVTAKVQKFYDRFWSLNNGKFLTKMLCYSSAVFYYNLFAYFVNLRLEGITHWLVSYWFSPLSTEIDNEKYTSFGPVTLKSWLVAKAFEISRSLWTFTIRLPQSCSLGLHRSNRPCPLHKLSTFHSRYHIREL